MRFRPMFLVPWWLFLWMSGSRYSLRRLIGNTLVAAIVTFAIAAAWFWAAKNVSRPFIPALPFVAYAAALAAAYTSLEPFLRVTFDSFAQRRLATAAIRQTGWGFTAWWALLISTALFWQAPKFPFLQAYLTYARSTDYYFGNLKFLVAVTIAALPFVILVRQTLIALDGARAANARPVAARATPGVVQPPPYRNAVNQGYPPPQQRVPPPRPQPRPARIISVDTHAPPDSDRK